MKQALSINEAIHLTGIGRTKLYELINKGKLKAKKMGKRTLILQSDLDHFLNQLSDYRD